MDLRDLSNAEDGGTRISAIGGDPYLATLAVVINLEWLGEIIFEALHVRALSTLFEDVARVVALDNSSMPEIYYLSDNDRRDFMARLVQTTAQNLYEEFLARVESDAVALLKSKLEKMPEIIENLAPQIYEDWKTSLDRVDIAEFLEAGIFESADSSNVD